MKQVEEVAKKRGRPPKVSKQLTGEESLNGKQTHLETEQTSKKQEDSRFMKPQQQ